jgi:hypothetical protein
MKRDGLNYKEVAVILFTKQPRPPHTIRIRLEGMEIEHMFEVLFSIFLEGYRMLFTVQRAMGFDELSTINEYMKSIGFIVKRHHTKKEISFCRYNYPRSSDEPPTITLLPHRHELTLDCLSDFYVDMTDYQLNMSQYVCC